jgi:flagellar L-ring protein precursor FlgH
VKRTLVITALIATIALPAQAGRREAEPERTVRQVSLYADVKARSVGDIVTVSIQERTQGSNSSKLTTKRKDKFEHAGQEGTGSFDFIPDFGLSAEFQKDLEGTGQQSRSGMLTARMAATVVKVRPNGDLEITGEREVEVNGETEVLTLSGVVRPADIGSGNVVLSSNIAEAKIAYKGKGVMSKGTKPSIFARVLGWIF